MFGTMTRDPDGRFTILLFYHDSLSITWISEHT